MKFLKEEIFYPEDPNSDANEKLMQKAWDDYQKEFEKTKSLMPKSLITLYDLTKTFHDYRILEMRYWDATSEKNDEIIMVIESLFQTEKYEIHFKTIFRYDVSFSISKRSVAYSNGGFNDIVLCELRYVKFKNSFNVSTANGCEILIQYNDFTYKRLKSIKKRTA